MTARIISVCNYKGGAGKSTIAVNLACALQRSLGSECLLVDADRQGTALRWSGSGKLAVKVVDRVLHEAREDDRYPGMLWITQIKMLAEKHPYIVIDMPPGLQFSLAAVTAVSDLILIPVNASGIDFHSTAHFINLIKKSRKIRASAKPGCLIVPNRLDRRTTIAQNLARYEQFEEPIAPAIGMRTAFAYAFDHGQWVGDFAPGTPAHREIQQLVDAIDGVAMG
jgi:chromosome partitioning protein